MTIRKLILSFFTLGTLCLQGGIVAAKEQSSCELVRFSDVGWTDITATTGMVTVVLDAIGYKTKVDMLSIPVTYTSMKNGDIDVYLGDWQPASQADRQPYLDDKSIEVLPANFVGAKYTFAVPKYVADAGVKDFADLQKFSEKFGKKIYGIEPGNNGNRMIIDIIEKGDFGLKDWNVLESSEQGMLTSVERAIKRNEWIVFLGWAPHPMNSRYQIEYLTGGDDYFGPNFGGADVFTDIRNGYSSDCPNVTKFLSNLRFSLEMENELMGAILEGENPQDAAKEWLKTHPDVVEPWLNGVTTFEGGDALSAAAQYIQSL